MDQIQEYNPSPNPAKLTDARATAYIAEFGEESWELDALEPAVISGLIRGAISELIDPVKWEGDKLMVEAHKKNIAAVADQWGEAVNFCLYG